MTFKPFHSTTTSILHVGYWISYFNMMNYWFVWKHYYWVLCPWNALQKRREYGKDEMSDTANVCIGDLVSAVNVSLSKNIHEESWTSKYTVINECNSNIQFLEISDLFVHYCTTKWKIYLHFKHLKRYLQLYFQRNFVLILIVT